MRREKQDIRNNSSIAYFLSIRYNTDRVENLPKIDGGTDEPLTKNDTGNTDTHIHTGM
jgi:hypothetical protein